MPETRCFGFKAAMLRWCGAKVGQNVRISSSAKFFGGGELVIGDDVWIGTDDVIHPVSGASIEIGSCCDLGPGIMILTGSHCIDPQGSHIAGKGVFADVIIGDGCWLCARSLILPGVRLEGKTIVAAGAVVVNSFDSGGLLTGVPAKLKRVSL